MSIFLLQFLASAPGEEAIVFQEKEILVQNTGEALEVMLQTTLPPMAKYARIISRVDHVVLVGWCSASASANASDLDCSTLKKNPAVPRPRRGLVPPRSSSSRRSPWKPKSLSE
jgi:hypothetical protein